MKYIYAKQDHLEAINDLWKVNRSTLGFMPLEAFKKYINANSIIICVDTNDSIKGYLQFRFIKKSQSLGIVHLCVSRDSRGKSVSEGLLDKLICDFQDKARGICLKCRNDYKYAIKFWERNNFQPKGESPSRGKDPTIKLIRWWYSFGSQDLFTTITTTKIRAIIGYDILSKLAVGGNSMPKIDDIECLFLDWSIDEIDYLYTSETLNEIFRADSDIKGSLKDIIADFTELNVNKANITSLEIDIQSLLGGLDTFIWGRYRHIAEAILSGVCYFVTLDQFLLSKSIEIETLYQLKIITPLSFITEVDTIANATDYYPSKLLADSFTVNRITPTEHAVVIKQFSKESEGEVIEDFSKAITLISVERKGIVNVIKEGGEIVAFYAYNFNEEAIIVPYIRVKKYALSSTVFMQLLSELMRLNIENVKLYLIITDPTLSNSEMDILERYGFEFCSPKGFIKIVSSDIIDYAKVGDRQELSSLPHLKKQVLDAMLEDNYKRSIWKAYYIEKKLWPLKTIGSNIPCFIVPIKAFYARQLFDTRSSIDDLFGIEPKLIWSNDNVYYRNIAPNVETFPARILWYSSVEKSSNRQMSIVASSYLDEIEIGPASGVYESNKHYGIFDWDKHILPLVKGNPNKLMKALKFSNSESFVNPMQLNYVKRVLARNGESDNNFQCPLKVSEQTYLEIYRYGRNIKS